MRFAPGLPEPARQALVNRVGAEVVHDLSLLHSKAVDCGLAAAQVLTRQAGVWLVEPDVLVWAVAKPQPSQPAQQTPWGVLKVGAPSVWAQGITGVGVTVAVIDTGIDTSHPDLQGAVVTGKSFVRYTKSYKDDNGHGTHVAGTVAARNNTIGVVGVAPGARLAALKALGRNGAGYTSDIAAAILWCVRNKSTYGIRAINMSLGSTGTTTTLRDAVASADSAGLLQVAAAGNSGLPTVLYPAAYANEFAGVLAVAASDGNDVVADFSNYGPGVTIAAPGVSILSTYKGGGYATGSGTSMACPHVAGTAALVFQANGALTNAAVRSLLEETAFLNGDANGDGVLDGLLKWPDLSVVPFGRVAADVAVAGATSP